MNEFSYLLKHLRMHLRNRRNFTPASGRQRLVSGTWPVVDSYVGFVVGYACSGSSLCLGIPVVVTEADINHSPSNKSINFAPSVPDAAMLRRLLKRYLAEK